MATTPRSEDLIAEARAAVERDAERWDEGAQWASVAAAAWDECVQEAFDLGWLHEYAAKEMRARNPYRQTEDDDYDSELAVMLSQMLDDEPMWSCVVIAKRLHAAGFRRAPAEPATQDESRPQMSEHTAPTGDEAHIRDDLALLIRETDSESDASCDCGHPRVEHDYGVGECYLSGCKCRKWEAATDDHEALVEVMTAATFVDGERRLVGWGPIADAILAAGFRRAPAEPADPAKDVRRGIESRLREQATNQQDRSQQ